MCINISYTSFHIQSMTYFSKSPVTKTLLNGFRMEFISDGRELSHQVASARRKKNEAAAQIKSRKKKKNSVHSGCNEILF